MIFRYFKEEDYNQLVEWWNFWRFTPPSLGVLPKGTGVIVNDGEKDVCAGFVYISNSDICWIEFIVSNPSEKDKIKRNKYITAIIDRLSILGMELGAKVAYTSLKNENLQNKYLDCGFVLGSKNCNEYIKVL